MVDLFGNRLFRLYRMLSMPVVDVTSRLNVIYLSTINFDSILRNFKQIIGFVELEACAFV